jgi:hypothetical protein
MRIRRNARRVEKVIRSAALPPSVMTKVARAHPELGKGELAAVEQGLRDWLICCGHRQGTQLGMPSRAVDWAWHELILHTPAYHRLCHDAYGEYLHHVPGAGMGVPMRVALRETVLAWDRSEAGRAGRETLLWELDERLGVPDPIGISATDRRAARMEEPDTGPLRRRQPGYADGRHAGWLWMGGGDGGGGHGCGGGGCGGGG